MPCRKGKQNLSFPRKRESTDAKTNNGYLLEFIPHRDAELTKSEPNTSRGHFSSRLFYKDADE
jgi:hypothetical protein